MAADPWGIQNEAVIQLRDEFRRIRSRLKPAMRKVAAKAAVNVKADARARILAQSTRTYIRQYPNSIGYTITESSGSVVSAEIGPDKDKPQGALGNILEYGTSIHPPFPHLQPAFEAEVDNFERFLGDAAEAAMFE